MKWLISILILATVLIAGCTQLNSISSIACKPNWKVLTEYAPNDDWCNTQCYVTFKTNHYMTENISAYGGLKCSCDVNNCNP